MDRANSPFWYVVHTKPGQEQRAARNLEVRHIEVFLPKDSRNSKQGFPIAFFPRYLFARFNENSELHLVNMTRGVSRVVSFGGIVARVDEVFIEAIRTRTLADGLILPRSKLVKGEKVRILAGPLQGLVGVLDEEADGVERVRVLLQAVRYSVRAVVPAGELVNMT